MGWMVAVGGVVGAAVLGLGLGGLMQPTLAARSDGPVETLESTGPTGPVDLTPPYVSPQSLAAERALETPARAQSDPIEAGVRRDLARADAELRASEAELASYRENAAQTVRVATVETSDDLRAAAERAGHDLRSSDRLNQAEPHAQR